MSIINIEDQDKNPIAITAVLTVILSFIPIYLCWIHRLSSQQAATMAGIGFNLVGAIWIASGVYIVSEDRDLVNKSNPARNKVTKTLNKYARSASNTIPMGIIYLILGSCFQIWACL